MKVKMLTAATAVALTMAGCATVQKTNTAVAKASAPARTMTDKLVDLAIERNIKANVASINGLTPENSRVVVDVLNGEVLLTGEIPSKEVGAEVVKAVSGVRGVQSTNIVGHLEATDVLKSRFQIMHDKYTQGKLMSKLKANGISAGKYKLAVYDDVAYMIGSLSPAEVAVAHKLITETVGVRNLVTSKALGATLQTGQQQLTQASPSTNPSNLMQTAGTQATTQNGYANAMPTYPASTYPSNSVPNTGYAPTAVQPSYPSNSGYVQPSPTGYPQNSGYQNNGYSNGGYPQNGYPQNGYPQNSGYVPNTGYTQPTSYPNGYPNTGYAQPAYSNNGTGYYSNPYNPNLARRPTTYQVVPAVSDYVRRWQIPTQAP